MGQKPIFLIILCILASVSSLAASIEGAHPGYLFDVSDERQQVSKEVIIVPPGENVMPVTRTDAIFTEKMTKEFSSEFRLRFGFTEFEQLEFTSNRFVSGGDNGRLVPVDEFIDKQEAFGQYMMRELAEYHVDNYLKSNRNTQVVYKAKEAISNVVVEAPSGYKVKFRYKISSNRVVIKLERKGEKFLKQIDTKLNGDSTTLRLGYIISKTVQVGADYSPFEEYVALRTSKRLTPTLSTSITGQSFQKDTESMPKQERVLLGLSWND